MCYYLSHSLLAMLMSHKGLPLSCKLLRKCLVVIITIFQCLSLQVDEPYYGVITRNRFTVTR